MATKEEMEAQGKFNDWLSAYQSTRQALSDTIISLNNELLTTPPSKQAPIQMQIMLQEDKINKLDNERLQFYAGRITMTPPDQATVQHLKELATQADVAIQLASASKQVINLANQALSLFNAATQKKA